MMDQFSVQTKKCPIIFNKKSGTSTLLSSKNILYFTNSDGLIEYDINNNKVLKKLQNLNLLLIIHL